MIRLNEALLSTLVPPAALSSATTADVSPPPASCPPMENHLISLRMQLYPSFAKSMSSQIDSLRKINGSLPAAGVFGGGKASGSNVKDAVVQVIARRYAELFNTVVALSGEGEGDGGDEEMVFSRSAGPSSTLRLPTDCYCSTAYCDYDKSSTSY